MLKKIKNYIKNKIIKRELKKTWIISVYFNIENKNSYRKKNFELWYKQIERYNHLIVECSINGSQYELENIVPKENLIKEKTDNILWIKEVLLNIALSKLPKNCKYVIWCDSDLLFSNENWVEDTVFKFWSEDIYVIQPFSMCYHLNKDQNVLDLTSKNSKWVSFAYNYANNRVLSNKHDYDLHGHVGFVWGARRNAFDSFYTGALCGGFDHISAHAFAGQIQHPCITKTYTHTNQKIQEWSVKVNNIVKGRLGYISGDVYHLWHGALDKRDYYNRIKNTDKMISYLSNTNNKYYEVTDVNLQTYMKSYFSIRENTLDNDDLSQDKVYNVNQDINNFS